jgi:hypothetical protein
MVEHAVASIHLPISSTPHIEGCPWSHCPNVAAAYEALLTLGFTQVKVLYIADNFGDNWVNLGYPAAKGQ